MSSFKLKSDESLRKGLRRIMRKQIQGALDQWKASRTKQLDEYVHELRKTLKKVRALLRLIRPRIAGRTYRTANAWLRDAARPLTEVRDARILVDVTRALASNYGEKVAGRTFDHVRKALQSNARQVRRRVLNDEHTLSTIQKTLHAVQPNIKKWTDVPNKWSSVGKGLERTYREASEAYIKASANPQIENLHELRKQTKYLRYQLEMLRPIWPDRIEEFAGEAERMGELLGDDHDLTLLRQTLWSNPERFGDARDIELLTALIDRRQAELRCDAIRLATRFFKEPSSDFVRPLKDYWHVWRDESQSCDSA